MSFRLSRLIAAVLTLAAAVASAATTPAPLSTAERDAVVAEIRDMVKTDDNHVKEFPVRQVTPDRLSRLLAMPEFLELPQNVRENALIFAGKRGILDFDKPSDVLRALERWFPEEFHAARAGDRPDFFGRLHIYGPYAGWDDEPAAFVSLWNCMPLIAWLKPDANPFQRRLNDGGLLLEGTASRSSAPQEFDFGYCLGHNSGLRAGWTEAQYRANVTEVRQLAAQVTPVLQRKFAGYLRRDRCAGTGPDDCVLLLHLWGGLSPDDPVLARMLRELEPDIAPDAPLPALEKPPEAYGDGVQDGEARFDAGLRQAAYFRTRLRSVLAAPAQWPDNELPSLFARLESLRTRLADAIDHRRSFYELAYYNETINPWGLLTPEVTARPAVRTALTAVIAGLEDDEQCRAAATWIGEKDAVLRGDVALARARAGRDARCFSPDWGWLAEGRGEEARRQRALWLNSLSTLDGALRDEAVSALTREGEACFGKAARRAPAWQRTLCVQALSEPQTVHYRLEHTGLRLEAADRFRAVTVRPLPENAEDAARDDWLAKRGRTPAQQAALRALSQAQRAQQQAIYAITRWQPRSGGEGLLELSLNGDPSRLLVQLLPDGIRTVRIPGRFRYQYDDGEVVAVSDLDRDRQPEVWLKGEWGECDGDGLRAGIDCAIPSIYLGEVRGSVLTWFHRDSAQPEPAGR